jgi:hypothetical protein
VNRTYVRYNAGVDLLDASIPVTEAAETMEIGALREALIAASASIAASQARVARAMAVFRERNGDQAESGFGSFGQWASVDLGMSARAATGLADAGAALANRPAIAAAWESGALSTSKAQCALGVATDASEAHWCELAREASATQLSRIASAYRRSERDGKSDRELGREAEDREALSGVWWHERDDDLVELLAVLAPDDAAVVRAALESQMEQRWRDQQGDSEGGHDDGHECGEDVTAVGVDGDDVLDQAGSAQSPSPRPTAQRRLEALLGLAATGLEVGPVPIVRGEHTEVVLHVDGAFLAGHDACGECHLTNGSSVGFGDARRLACDARIRPLLVGADGSSLDLGRAQRLVSNRQRRLLKARDHGCCFPGCSNTRYVDAHHVWYWEDGGPTDMANLLLLCNRHHRLVHHEAFRIEADGEQGFEFFDRFDRPIRPPDRQARHRCADAPDIPRARSGGDPHYSIDLAVTAMASAS